MFAYFRTFLAPGHALIDSLSCGCSWWAQRFLIAFLGSSAWRSNDARSAMTVKMNSVGSFV